MSNRTPLLVLSIVALALVAFIPAAAAQSSGSPYLVQFVSACANNSPLYGAQVSIAGQSAQTDSQGFAYVYGLSPHGAYNAVIRDSGYQPIIETIYTNNAKGENYYSACLEPNSAGNMQPPYVTASSDPASGITSSEQVTLTASATGPNGIAWTAIDYKLGSGQPQQVPCAATSCSVIIGPLQTGVTVTYSGSASDLHGNVGNSQVHSFTVLQGSGGSGSGPGSGNNSNNNNNFPPALNVFRTPSDPVAAGSTVIVTAGANSANGIANVTITYQVGSGQQQSVTCFSSLCQVQIASVPASTTISYSASAVDSSPTHLTSTSPTFSFNTQSTTSNGGSIAVHASDCSTGNALSGALVTITNLPLSEYTDTSGNTLFTPLSQGSYYVTVSKAGYTLAVSGATVLPNTQTQLNICADATTGDDFTPPVVNAARNPSGYVDYTDPLTFSASSSDSSGILWTAVFYSFDDGSATEAVCPSNYCTLNAGPFPPGSTITYWGEAKDGSTNGNVGYSTQYTFTIGPTSVSTTTTTTTTTSTTSTTQGSGTNGNNSGLVCAVYLSPSSGVAGTPVEPTVTYSDNDGSIPAYASVDCGNGVVLNAQCANTTQDSGSCTNAASYCNYQYSGNYQVSANVSGVACSPATESATGLSAPGQGVLLVRTLDSSSFARIPDAQVSVDGNYGFTNSYGEVSFTLPSGNYTISAQANGYGQNAASATVYANQTTLVQIPLSTVANAGGSCQVLSELTSNSCSSGTQDFSIRLQANASAPIYSSIAFDSPISVSGPNIVYLPSSNPDYLNYTINIPQNYAGSSTFNAFISTNSTGCTGSQLQIPVCPSTGITLQLAQSSLTGTPGEQACTQAYLTNDGSSSQTITLTSSGTYPSSFNPPQVVVGGQSSMTVNYCISVPSGADGSSQYTVSATSASGPTASAALELNVFGQGSFTLNYSACNATGNSTGPSGLYTVAASAPGFTSESQNDYVQQDFPNVASICLAESNSSITTPPDVDIFRSPSSTVVNGEGVRLIADGSSPAGAGISVVRIFYTVNNNQPQEVTCNSDTCATSIGPFNAGDSVTYYAQAIDASTNHNSATSQSYTFTVEPLVNDEQNTLPSISISINPTGVLNPTDALVLTESASSSYNIQSTTIYYKIGSNSWQSSSCLANSCSFYLGSFPVGTTIYYFGSAEDEAAPSNTAQTDIQSVTITPQQPTATIGDLLEYVYNCNTLAPISGATVSVSGASATYLTDANGFADVAGSTFSSASALSFNNNGYCSCINLPPQSKSVVPISIYNNGPAGDFVASVDSEYPGLFTSTVEPSIDGLGNGQWRTTYLDIDTNGLTSGNYTFDFNLNSQTSGAQVYNSNICVYIPPTTQANLEFVPSAVTLGAGQQAQVQVTVTNTGDSTQTIDLAPQPVGYLSLTLSTTVISLAAGQSQTVNGVITASASTPLGLYSQPIEAQIGGVSVQESDLAVTIAPFHTTSTTPLSGITITPNLNTPLPTTGSALVPVVIQNNNLYPISGATVFFDSLPPGAISRVTGPFDIPAFGTSYQLVEIDTTNVPPGFYQSVLRVESPTDSDQVEAILPIGISAAPLLVTIGVPQVSYSFSSGTDVSVAFNVTNNELGTLNLSASIDGLSPDFTQQTQPAGVTLAPGATAQFTTSLHSDNSPTTDYNASIVVLSSSGRIAREPVTIAPLSASSATGFFILGFSGNWAIVAIIGLLIIAGVLFYLARYRLEDATAFLQGKAQ